MNFVVFSDDWGRHPSSSQHIFRHIARQHRVLWVNTIGMRMPRMSLGDLRKAAAKVTGMLKMSKPAEEWTERPPLLSVIQPLMLPLPRSSAARLFNSMSLKFAISNELSRLSMKDPVFVTTVPNVEGTLKRLPGLKIYYCVDDFSQWPGLAHDAVRTMEARLISMVDAVLAASPALCTDLMTRHSRVELFPHGVDLELYDDCLPQPEWLARTPTPRIGFYGLLDERLDKELISCLASARPDWTFILAGPRVASFADLEKLANVRFPGSIPYRELPAMVGGLDALIMPYKVDSFTHTLAPLKLNEYMLSGRPVITSALAGIPENHPLIRIARSPSDWLDALQSVQSTNHEQRRRIASNMLAGQGWDSRAAVLLQYVAEAIKRSGP